MVGTHDLQNACGCPRCLHAHVPFSSYSDLITACFACLHLSNSHPPPHHDCRWPTGQSGNRLLRLHMASCQLLLTSGEHEGCLV